MSDDLYDIGDLDDPNDPEFRLPKKKRRWPRVLGFLFLTLITLVGVGAVGAYLLYDHITHPRAGIEEVEFVVPEGATGQAVGRLLAEQGFIEHELFFRVAIALNPSSDSIRHGKHVIFKGESPVQLLDHLRSTIPVAEPGEVFKVTIPEGLTIAQIAEIRPNPAAFLEATAVLDLFGTFGVSARSAEGFLMPNTYFFDKEPDATALVTRMAEQFNHDYAVLLERYPDAQVMDKVSLLIIASLIEEEARLDHERALVSAVIHNRLEKKMPLEMDSTLQYALNKYGQRLLNEDKEVDSPYNTYKRRGLPPGPISNPGIKSIEAALNPADVDYIFFVSNADGKSHTFTSNLRDHNNAVAKFRREIREQRRQQQ
ncbi:MAG: endolytic transglycosylase MltG [Candidatus Hydrogenedentota bacterium]